MTTGIFCCYFEMSNPAKSLMHWGERRWSYKF